MAISTITPASLGGVPAFSAYRSTSTDTTFTLATWTKVILDAETYDTNGCFDTSTYRFTPNVAGYYQINASIFSNWSTSQFSSYFTSIFKNGSEYRTTQILVSASTDTWYGNVNVEDIVYLNGSTDYIEIYVKATGGSGPVYNGASNRTYASGSLVRGA